MAILIDFSEFAKNLPIVESSSIYTSGKESKKFDEAGLYSEKIFGSLKISSCSCGLVRHIINDGIVCPSCGVLNSKKNLRNTQFAKIELPTHIILPTLIKNLHEMFGQTAIKSILNKNDYQHNKEDPYYYNPKLLKLVKSSNTNKDDILKDYPVFDITSLYSLFIYLKAETDYLIEYENKQFLNYIFIDFILVLPVNSRPIIKITDDKSNVHPITLKYCEILKNIKTSLADSLFKYNPTVFGETVYKYQQSVNELYELILEKNFQDKESVARNYMMGKIIEHSGRFVIVPNPILRPYQIGLPKQVITDINKIELVHFLSDKKIKNFNIDSNQIMGTIQYIHILTVNKLKDIDDDIFHEFIKENKNKLIYIVERPPVLWKYNTTAFTLGFYTKEKNKKIVFRTFSDFIKILINKEDLNPDVKKLSYRQRVKKVNF